VSENIVLRAIFEPIRDEVTGGWRIYMMRISPVCYGDQMKNGEMEEHV
jgi:hypothetical protein